MRIPSLDSRTKATAGVFIAVFSVAWAAILIRFANQANPLAIAFWRVFIAAAVLTPFYWSGSSNESEKLSRRELRLTLTAGLFLAFHFAVWISSLSHTTVAS